MNSQEKHKLFLEGKYVSINSRVNNLDGSINQKGFEQVLEEMHKEGFEEVDYDSIYIGDLIRYLRNEGSGKQKFVAAGYVRSKDSISISYLSNTIRGIYKKDIIRIWRKDGRTKSKPKTKKINKPVFKPVPEGEYKYSVVLNGITIYKTSDKWKYERFQESIKYKRAQEHGFIIQ